mmetsp:Transcript_100181/g.139214  ORF Transcript_100181/g.139214 Transcript_100181/m.139214 type:complete len:142 (-) Transcript_100181:135-560(-)
MSDQLSQAQQNEYKDVFSHFDKGKGNVDMKVLAMLMKSMGEAHTESELQGMFGGSTVDFNRFLQNRQEKWAREQSGEEVKAAFEVFDLNGDGTISVEDLRHTMTTMGDVMSDKEIEDMVRDAGGGSTINYNDFVDKMKRKT